MNESTAVSPDHRDGSEIAIIGMAGRFPGALTIDKYWENLRDGKESITFFSEGDLLNAGVEPRLISHPNYVRANGALDDVDKFDAAFFGLNPREAAIMDPQHRHFLECAWEAVEHAGYDPYRFDGLIGIFGGSGHNAYLSYNLLTNPELVESVGFFLLRHTGNDKDFLTTRVSYAMNLKGPSVNVQTACSTSLVAVHLAGQSLLNRECDMALAGGVTIELPHRQGYLALEGEILSPDGHCRAFDADAGGTVFGSGVGLVVLRRLEDALAAGDTIHAIIRGSAVNNDGAGKVNYLAPSVDGQTAAITEAIAIANVDAETISYIETHGTGTRIGDPIEVAALSQAFRAFTDRMGYCGLGSVKTNIGHLDTAAGVAGLIKTVLALKHKQIPPSLHYKSPNPLIDFDRSAFYVNAGLKEWSSHGPRRAGVNSLGVGGTNAFVVLEEPQARKSTTSLRPFHLLTLSARSAAALEAMSKNLAAFLQTNPQPHLADVAFTLQVGRREFDVRRTVVCDSVDDAVEQLMLTPKRGDTLKNRRSSEGAPSVVFMFPGGGAQYPGMGEELYRNEPVFRENIDHCLQQLEPIVRAKLKTLMYPAEDELGAAHDALLRPSMALPALFITEYALAKWWMSHGVRPDAMIGHSMGEYTAACLSGVITLRDALAIVRLRGELFESLPDGAMLSVPLSEKDVTALLSRGLSIAAINSPELCVIAGEVKDIEALEQTLTTRDIEYRRVPIQVAAHSPMLDPILEEFRAHLREIPLSPPEIPYVSNVTGSWVTSSDATDPDYWVRHLRQTVRYSDGLSLLLNDDPSRRILLEVGPGQALISLVRAHPARKTAPVESSFPRQSEEVSELRHVYNTLGSLWQSGVAPYWMACYTGESPSRIPLPTYPFEHQSYWIEPGKRQVVPVVAEKTALKKMPEIADWFYRSTWQRKEAAASTVGSSSDERLVWLILIDELGLGEEIASKLRRQGHRVITVGFGRQFAHTGDDAYVVAIEHLSDYEELFEELSKRSALPQRLVHLWLVDGQKSDKSMFRLNDSQQNRGFFSLLLIAQALGGRLPLEKPLDICVVSNGMQSVNGESLPFPKKATVLGPCAVIPKEYPGIACRSVDIEAPVGGILGQWSFGRNRRAHLVEQLITEFLTEPRDQEIAYRNGERWVRQLEAAPIAASSEPALGRLRQEGVYLITGGLGGIGLTLASYLAGAVNARLALVSQSGFPERSEWEDCLSDEGSSPKLRQRIRAVQALEAQGADVLVVRADVTDVAAMTSALAQVERRFGTIHGVIHGAGTLSDGLIQLKSPEDTLRVLAPKVVGTLVLDSLLKSYPLDFFFLMSSTSVYLGPVGQVDYVAANTFLNAFASSRAVDANSKMVAINWGMWQGVGMAANAARQQRMGRLSDSSGPTPEHPLLDLCTIDSSQKIEYSTTLRADSTWVVSQHRIKGGEAVFPGTGYLELAIAALEKGRISTPVLVEDLYFTAPMIVPEDEAVEIRTTLRKESEGFAFFIASRVEKGESREGGWLEHATGLIRRVSREDIPEAGSLDEIKARCGKYSVQYDADMQQIRQETYLDFGPRWKNLREVHFGEEEAIALLDLPEQFTNDLKHYCLHPALLDLATGFALPLIDGYESSNDFYVPVAYGVVRVFGPLTGKLYSHARVSAASVRNAADLPAFDVTVYNNDGGVLVDIRGFVMKRVDPVVMRSEVDNVRNMNSALGNPDESSSKNTPPTLLELGMTDGIAPREGIEAFQRILGGHEGSQIIVSSLNMPALIERAESQPSPVNQDATMFQVSRPQLTSEYVAPRTPVEKTLATIWVELLGIGQVGIHDDFFELGGHSLIALRVFSRIKKTYAAQFSIATLFDYPTIAELASLLAPSPDHTEAAVDQGQPSTPPHSAYANSWSPLVRIQPKGTKVPFFCVHGIYGNVLEFNGLSRYLGKDQPFYGLQAPGTDGLRAAIDRIEDLASLYLAHIKTVQPEGPYQLGGYSLGGEIAYEMGQQLKARGDEVALLVLFDTYEPVVGRQKITAIRNHRLSGLVAPFQGEKESFARRWTKRFIKYYLHTILSRLYLGFGWRVPHVVSRYAIGEAHMKAVLQYTPGPYSGPVVLFRTSETCALGQVNPAESWASLVERLEVQSIEGTHAIMVEPYVEQIARTLMPYLGSFQCVSDSPHVDQAVTGVTAAMSSSPVRIR